MKCTECSKPVKPVVAIDIDGTLGDYHGHFLKFAAMYTGNDIVSDYGGKGSFKEWFLERMPYETEDSWHDIKLAYRQGGMKRSMPMYPFAAELCRLVRENGIELWLTTTRPYLRLDNVDPDTRFWLNKHDIQYDGLLYDEFKYGKLAEYVEKERVIAIVDDLPEMWEAAGQHFGWKTPVLRINDYNRGARADGYEDLRDIWHNIKGRLSAWKIAYE